MRCIAIVLLAMATGSTAVRAQSGAAASAAEAPDIGAANPGLFRKLFITLARDLRRLPSNENRPILLNGAMLALEAYPLDGVATLGASSSPFLKASFAGFGKALGREWIQGGAAVAAYAAGRVWHAPRVVEASGDLIEAQIVSLAVTQGAKFLVGRTRPDGEARSFPSGHASAAFATASTLHRHFGRKAAIPAYAIAAYTSASRLQANSHFASDVIAGAALGIAIGRTATFQLGQHHLKVTPTPVPGGVAVIVAPLRD